MEASNPAVAQAAGPESHMEAKKGIKRGLLGSTVSKKVLESLETVKAVKIPQGVIRPKAEQDMVGFGFREIMGLRSHQMQYPSSDTQMVYYATNRKSEGEDDHGSIFGKQVNGTTNFGLAEIQCPDGKPLVHRDFQATHSMNQEDFRESLKQQIAADKNKAVLVYVHGCFTDFGRGVGYGAYILRGLDFKGPMVVYSWPSVGRPSVRDGLVKAVELYRVDEGTCMRSAEQLKDLLRFLSKDLGAESVHVVAYSMGARALIEAMRLFEPEDDLPVTSHLYFIAPDVAAHHFSETLRDFRFPGLRRLQAQGSASPSLSTSTTSGAGESEERSKSGSMGQDVRGTGVGGTTLEGQGKGDGVGERGHVGGGRSGASGSGRGPVEEGRSGSARDGSHGQASSSEDGGLLDRAIMHDMVERVADAWNFVGDNVAGIRQLAQAWREARMTGWEEMQEGITQQWKDGENLNMELEEPGAAAPDALRGSPIDSTPGGAPHREGAFRGQPGGNEPLPEALSSHVRLPRRSAHVHLYAAQNDIALLLSELTDPGVPKIRAGRATKDFMLCNDFFNTVDVTSLKTGLLTTGHFYLFHEVVKEEMAHVLTGRQGDTWWRQGMQWENGHQYIRLRSIHPVKLALVDSAVRSWKSSSEYTMQPQVDTTSIYWASA